MASRARGVPVPFHFPVPLDARTGFYCPVSLNTGNRVEKSEYRTRFCCLADGWTDVTQNVKYPFVVNVPKILLFRVTGPSLTETNHRQDGTH